MKTLLYPAYDRLEVTEMPDPQVGDGELLLRVSACGICGSELEAFRRRSPRRVPPLVLGHEFCGEVVDTGRGVSNFKTGQRVVSHSLAGCGECVRCKRGEVNLCARRQIFGMQRLGAFAELVTAPESCVVGWPDHLPAEAASLAEVLANGVHVAGLVKRLDPRKVVVIGAGPIGLMTQQALQVLLGAQVMASDLIPERLEAATKLGAKQVVNPKQENFQQIVLDWTDGEGADVIVDAVGSPITKQQSLQATRPGGATVWIGSHENTVMVDTYDITLSERCVQGSYAATMAELQLSVDLLAAGKIDGLSWVKAFPLDQGVMAFNQMLAAEGDDIKGVLCP
ncbi:MAG: alcohol dehydrogenase catalytic domain-containing protein [Acidobacteriota bacterium]|nr:alcohol dehydrogenase catalytic domain-containing protein [Acidobacteriota bacterium]